MVSASVSQSNGLSEPWLGMALAPQGKQPLAKGKSKANRRAKQQTLLVTQSKHTMHAQCIYNLYTKDSLRWPNCAAPGEEPQPARPSLMKLYSATPSHPPARRPTL